MAQKKQPSVRFLRTGNTTKSEPPRSPRWADVILQRLAWSSQIVLVLAGVLGYIFTVRPVHQKQLLDEQIAERTIALKTASETLNSLQSEAERLRSENSRLGTEAKQTYEQLRSKLSLEIVSIPYECAVSTKGAPRTAKEVPDCVMQFAQSRIAKELRPNDREALYSAIKGHSNQMISSSAEVTRRFAAKTRQLTADIEKTKSDLENSTPEIRAEIHRLRIARANGRPVEPDPPTGRIIIRAEEDQRAYDNYFERRSTLINRLNQLNHEKIFFEYDLGRAYRDALEKSASEILDDFRKSIRNP